MAWRRWVTSSSGSRDGWSVAAGGTTMKTRVAVLILDARTRGQSPVHPRAWCCRKGISAVTRIDQAPRSARLPRCGGRFPHPWHLGWSRSHHRSSSRIPSPTASTRKPLQTTRRSPTRLRRRPRQRWRRIRRGGTSLPPRSRRLWTRQPVRKRRRESMPLRRANRFRAARHPSHLAPPCREAAVLSIRPVRNTNRATCWMSGKSARVNRSVTRVRVRCSSCRRSNASAGFGIRRPSQKSVVSWSWTVRWP